MRPAVVCSISLPGLGPDNNRLKRVLDRAGKWLDLAAKNEPDIVCLPESMNGLGLGGKEWAACAEDVPGPTTIMASDKAAEYSMYVVCPIVRRDSVGPHNTAILYDRCGDFVGMYDKVHPTIGEIEVGVTPGKNGFVSDLDFGRVGFAICFDLNFRDLRNFYRRKGAEIVFFPSMYRGGIQLRLWAYEIGCYMVSATPGEQSAIIDPLGRILQVSQATSSTMGSIICESLNLDFSLLHLDYNADKLECVKNRYGNLVDFQIAVPEGIFLLFSKDPDRNSADIVKEFDLETRKKYFRRASAIRKRALTNAVRGGDEGSGGSSIA